jgi:hypothetical protein
MVPILASLVRELVCHVHTREQCGHSTPVASLCKPSCIDLLQWRQGTEHNLISVRYISALEERVAFLEARLPDHAEDHYDPSLENPTSSPSRDTGDLPTLGEQTNGSGHSHRASISEDQDVDDRTSLIDGVAYLSLCASGTTGGKHEPYYVGSSSGATIARVLQSSIFRSAGRLAIGQPALADDCQSSETSRPSLSAHSEEPIYEFPDWEQSRMLFDVFFERIHTRWPLLDRVIYTQVFEKQYGQGSLTITERSILHLIYAITARFLSLTRKPCGVDYEVSSEKSNFVFLTYIK